MDIVDLIVLPIYSHVVCVKQVVAWLHKLKRLSIYDEAHPSTAVIPCGCSFALLCEVLTGLSKCRSES